MSPALAFGNYLREMAAIHSPARDAIALPTHNPISGEMPRTAGSAGLRLLQKWMCPVNLLPLLPLRDIVVFPGMVVPLFVGREKSVAALEAAMAGEKDIFLLAQLDPGCDDPDRDDLYDTGVVASVLQLLKLPDGTVRVLVEGQYRARLESLRSEQGGNGEMLVAQVEKIEAEAAAGTEVAAMMRSVIEQFGEYAKLNKKLSQDAGEQLADIEDPSKLADGVAAQLNAKVADKQALLSEADPLKRLEMAYSFMEGELGVLQVERKIRGRVKRQMEKTQREYYLNEQLKAIQRELGNESEEGGDELAELAQKIRKTRLSKEAGVRANAELKKLKAMAPMSAEATVARNYLDVLLGIQHLEQRRRRIAAKVHRHLVHFVQQEQRIADFHLS